MAPARHAAQLIVDESCGSIEDACAVFKASTTNFFALAISSNFGMSMVDSPQSSSEPILINFNLKGVVVFLSEWRPGRPVRVRCCAMGCDRFLVHGSGKKEIGGRVVK